jgi:hypothetical protein
LVVIENLLETLSSKRIKIGVERLNEKGEILPPLSKKQSFLRFNKSASKLIFSHYEDEDVNEWSIFFNELTKLTNEDFKVDFWSMNLQGIIFCRYIKGKLYFDQSLESDWYNYNKYPYFTEKALENGLKEGEDGYDEDLLYDLFIEFRGDYLNNYDGTEIAVAPEWYKE